MQRVWNELRRRKRVAYDKGEEFLHAPQLMEGVTSISRDDAQAGALVTIFMGTVSAATHLKETGELGHYVAMATSLRADATSVLRRKGRKHRIVANVLRRAADAYLRMAGLLARDQARQVSAGIATVLRDFVGSPLYKTAATLASVALDREISLSQVRKRQRSRRKNTMGKTGKKGRAAPDAKATSKRVK
jgi:hypothetical protein